MSERRPSDEPIAGHLVTVAEAQDPIAAGFGRDVLAAHGISAVAVGSQASTLFGATLLSRLLVDERDLDRACEILSEERISGLLIASEGPGSAEYHEARERIRRQEIVDPSTEIVPFPSSPVDHLEWVRVGGMFELRADGFTCAVMEISESGDAATVDSADQTWSFSIHSSGSRESVRVESASDGVIAELEAHGEGVGYLEFPGDGARLTDIQWDTGAWCTEEDLVIRYHSTSGLSTHRAEVEIDSSLWGTPHLFLMVALGWFLSIDTGTSVWKVVLYAVLDWFSSVFQALSPKR